MTLAPRLLAFLLSVSCAGAATWTHSWPPSGDEGGMRASVCPLKFDKKWAYAIELDDGTIPTGTFAPDFFAEFQYTDAPPGAGKGRQFPVVGSLALYPYRVGANNTLVNFQEVREICGKGWAVANHSYSHKGKTYGDVPEILTPEQIREELFWSQAVFAHELGQAPTHFVYPNGYTGYADSLGAFGLVSGSSVGGKGGISLVKMGDSFLSIPRCYLDEGAWTNPYRKGNPMDGIPPDGPAQGDFIIDFTHNISPDPNSANQKRWRERLTTLISKFGAGGTDEFWSAPTQEVISYWRAAKAAKVQLDPGKLSISLPDALPGTPLTIRLEGVPANTTVPAPPGGSIFRKDGTVWITTPGIGTPGAAPLIPAVKVVFKGPPSPSISLDAPCRIAGVRVKQHGNPTPDRQLSVNITRPDGSVEKLASQTQGDTFISGTHIFSSVPNREAPLAKSVEITSDPSIKEVEIWALDDAKP